jgi:hypothetical protein
MIFAVREAFSIMHPDKEVQNFGTQKMFITGNMAASDRADIFIICYKDVL